MLGKDAETNSGDNGQTSIIAKGCKFEGTVSIKGTFRIEGEFKGDIGVPENMVIGKSGVVNAACKVKNAIIGGELYGNIEAENKIELQSGSRVEGDIKTKRLVIDEGVFFEGNCSMGGGQRKSAPPVGAPKPTATATPREHNSGHHVGVNDK
jgi:cytoskeletal protein CcmA (bactofilin family)